MATPTVVVLVLVALGSIATLVWLVLLLVRRLRAVADDVQDLQRHVGPSLQRLQQDVEVTNRELDRMGRTLNRVEDGASNASHGPYEPNTPEEGATGPNAPEGATGPNGPNGPPLPGTQPDVGSPVGRRRRR